MEIILGKPPGIKSTLVPMNKFFWCVLDIYFAFGLSLFIVILQRFFRHLCMSAKVPTVVRLVKEALIEDKCVVIGLQSTGEARTEEAVSKYVCNWILILFHIGNFFFSIQFQYVLFICFLIGFWTWWLCFWTPGIAAKICWRKLPIARKAWTSLWYLWALFF